MEGDEKVPVGHQHIKCNLIFDINIDFTRKPRMVVGGHMTDPTASITYLTIISCDSVRILFVIAAMNGLDILAADIANTYLNDPLYEKFYFTYGAEFGNLERRQCNCG